MGGFVGVVHPLAPPPMYVVSQSKCCHVDAVVN